METRVNVPLIAVKYQRISGPLPLYRCSSPNCGRFYRDSSAYFALGQLYCSPGCVASLSPLNSSLDLSDVASGSADIRNML